MQARGYTLAELFASYHVGPVQLSLTVDNLFDVLNEAQFATTSRLHHEPAQITELNYTPGPPRSIQLGAAVRF